MSVVLKHLNSDIFPSEVLAIYISEFFHDVTIKLSPRDEGNHARLQGGPYATSARETTPSKRGEVTRHGCLFLLPFADLLRTNRHLFHCFLNLYLFIAKVRQH